MNSKTWEMYDNDEYFKKFLRPHPQLQYHNDDNDLYNLQNILTDKYNKKVYTKDEVISIYNNYVEKKNEELTLIYSEEHRLKEYLKYFKQNKKQITNNFIQDLIKEI